MVLKINNVSLHYTMSTVESSGSASASVSVSASVANVHELPADPTDVVSYLTDKSMPHFEKVMDIVNEIKTVIHPSYCISIYGGFLRDIISSYFDPSFSFNLKDVDIWISPESCHFSLHSWRRFTYKLFTELSLGHTLTGGHIFENYHINGADYCMCRIGIDGMMFDMSTEINDTKKFEDVADFSVNNLYFTTDGKIGVRSTACCSFPIATIIEHIRNKKLHNVVDHSVTNKWCYNDSCSSAASCTCYETSFARRKAKMMDYGFTDA